MSLKCYSIDYSFEKHWQVGYDKIKALKIVKKLARHFKLEFFEVYFNCNTKGYANNGYIQLPKKNIALGIICHELGHLLAFKNGYRGHTKKSYKYIKRIYKYAIKYIPTEFLLDINKNQLLLEAKGI